jgi:hypothetical protein
MATDMMDATSFDILIKALVKAHALSKAKDRLKQMTKEKIQPCIGGVDAMLAALTHDGRYRECFNLLEDLHAWGVTPSKDTLNTVARLVNETRDVDHCCSQIRRVLHKYKSYVKHNSEAATSLPRLAAVMTKAEEYEKSSAPCAHDIEIMGSLPHIKAVRKTLKQHGFLDKDEANASPLDGHWETDYGLTVVIEGKIVRWSGKRASKLSFMRDDLSACMLTLHGKATHGHLVSPPVAPDARKTLVWDNGEVWCSYDGRVIGKDTLLSQTMSKTCRNTAQDEAYRSRSQALLKCVSRQGLGMPAILEEGVVQFLGNDLYHVRVAFASKWNPSCVDDEELPLFDDDERTCDTISRQHPNVGVRHCWADWYANHCGQRTLVNGMEVDERSFSQHIGAVRWS